MIESLEKPGKKLDEIWAREAEKRLQAYREGRLEGVPMDDVFPGEYLLLYNRGASTLASLTGPNTSRSSVVVGVFRLGVFVVAPRPGEALSAVRPEGRVTA